MFNYLDPELNPAFTAFLISNKIDPKQINLSSNAPNEVLDDLIDGNDRSYAVQKIFDLHQ
jgi:hypothetical protein